jgi:hypothetical protein
MATGTGCGSLLGEHQTVKTASTPLWNPTYNDISNGLTLDYEAIKGRRCTTFHKEEHDENH